jgi:DNA-binding LacI/PurR family transcriptional regulator
MEDAELEPHVVETDDTTIETGQEGMAQILRARPETTAVVAVNDAMAIGAIKEGRALGKRVPETLAVVGFDNISWAALSDPPLTTVDVPTMEMGRAAARLLLDRWEGTLTVPSRTTLATQVVVRASCGCPPDRVTSERRTAQTASSATGDARPGAEG